VSSICTDRDNAPRARGHRGQLFDARAGNAKGVAERGGATVRIDPVDRKATHIKVYTGFSAPIAIVAVIHDARCAAIEAAAPPYWWQCSVLFEPLDTADYLKTDPRGCGGTSVRGLGYPLWRALYFTDALRRNLPFTRGDRLWPKALICSPPPSRMRALIGSLEFRGKKISMS
jgi:hypothetical protein